MLHTPPNVTARPANIGSEKRRVRGDVTATRWLCFQPDATLDTLDKIEAHLKFYRSGQVNGDATLAGIAEALALNATFGEPAKPRDTAQTSFPTGFLGGRE